MRLLIWLLVATLVIFHQDFWNWSNASLEYGIVPAGLAYHIWISLAASFVWLLACIFAWPEGVDEFDNDPGSSSQNGGDA